MTSTATDSVRRSDRPSPTLGSCPCRAARTRSEGSVGAGRAGQAPVSASRRSSAGGTSSSSRRACRACLGAARRRSPRHGAPSPRPTGRAPIGASALTARHVGVGDLPQLGQPVNGDAQAVDLPGVAARTAPRCASAASASAASSSPMSLIICASSLLHRYSRLSLLIRRPRVDTPPATEPALS